MNIPTVKPSILKKMLFHNAKRGIVTMIWGASGVGKSAIMKQVADELGAKFHDLRANLFDPVDVRGGLKVIDDNGHWRTVYGIPEDYPAPGSKDLHFLAIDEITTAPKATMNALLQLLLDRRIGSYTLPENTIIACAGNRAIDDAAVFNMPSPVKNRMAHFTVEPNKDDFADFCTDNRIDPIIPSFIRFRPDLLHNMDRTDTAFPTPRSYIETHKSLQGTPYLNDPSHDDMLRAIVSSHIGTGAGGEFVTFVQFAKDAPDIGKILNAPGSVSIPTKSSVKYATIGMLASGTDVKTFKPFTTYVERMEKEFQVMYMRDVIRANKSLVTEKPFEEWRDKNSDLLF